MDVEEYKNKNIINSQYSKNPEAVAQHNTDSTQCEISLVSETSKNRTSISKHGSLPNALSSKVTVKSNQDSAVQYNSDQPLIVKSFSAGFKYVGWHVQVLISHEDCNSEPFWVNGIIKFWYPKFNYFFIHLLNTKQNTSHESKILDKYQGAIKSEISGSRTPEGNALPLKFSKYGNKRGWVSFKNSSFRLVSSNSIWKAFGSKILETPSCINLKSQDVSHSYCQKCEKVIAFPERDCLVCEICKNCFHSRCLDFLDRKPLMRLFQDVLCREAKDHREYVVKRGHEEKLLMELKSNRVKLKLCDRRVLKRKYNFENSLITFPEAAQCGKKKKKGKRSNNSFSETSNSNGKSSTIKTFPNERLKRVPEASSDSGYLSDSSFSNDNVDSYFSTYNKQSYKLHSCQTSFIDKISNDCSEINKKKPSVFCDPPPNEYINKSAEKVSPWHCPSCSVCIYCNELLDEVPPLHVQSAKSLWRVCDRLGRPRQVTPKVICYVCGLKAHGACCCPEVPLLHPNARWKCDRCAVCHMCGYRNIEWFDYSNWDPCFLYCSRCYRSLQIGEYCCVCRQLLNKTGSLDISPSCQSCRFHAHTRCDRKNNISKSDEGTPTKQSYLCAVCHEGKPYERYSRILERFFVLDRKRDFCFPVPFTCLSYWRVVKSPMNLSEMKAKVHYQLYSDDLDFLTDLFLIFYNAKMAYMPNTRIYRHANSLEQKAIRFSFSILGLGKPTKETLMDLSLRATGRGSKDSTNETLLSTLQDCYDFEHLKFFPEWSKEFFAVRSKSVPQHTPYRGTNPPSTGELFSNVEPIVNCTDRSTKSDIMLNSELHRSHDSFITSSRIHWMSSSPVELALWWFKASDVNSFIDSFQPQPCNIEHLFSEGKSDNGTEFFVEDYQQHLEFLSAKLKTSQTKDNYITDAVEFVESILDTTLKRFDQICLCCCVTTFVNKDPSLFDCCSLSTTVQSPYLLRISLCSWCARCRICGNSTVFLPENLVPYPFYPSIKNLCSALAQHSFRGIDSETQKRSLQWIYLRDQVLESTKRHLNLAIEESCFASDIRGSLFPTCLLCHQFIHFSCEKVDSLSMSLLCKRDRNEMHQWAHTDHLVNSNSHNLQTMKSNSTEYDNLIHSSSIPSQDANEFLSYYKKEPIDTLLPCFSHHKKKISHDRMAIMDLSFYEKIYHIKKESSLMFYILEDYKSASNLNFIQFFFVFAKRFIQYESLQSPQLNCLQNFFSKEQWTLLPYSWMYDMLSRFKQLFCLEDVLPFPTGSASSYLTEIINSLGAAFLKLLDSNQNYTFQTSKLDGSIVSWSAVVAIILYLLKYFRRWCWFCLPCLNFIELPLKKNQSTLPFISGVSTALLHELFQWRKYSSTISSRSTAERSFHNDSFKVHSNPPEEPQCVSPLLFCRVCGRTCDAWAFEDLRDLKLCLLNIPFLCEFCKQTGRAIKKTPQETTTEKNQSLRTVLEILERCLIDLRIRLRSTYEVHSLLSSLVSLRVAKQDHEICSYVSQFMDSPVFTPYRYRFLKDSFNFVLHQQPSHHPMEYVRQVNPCVEQFYSFPLFHQWLASHPQRPATCEYTFFRNTLNVCLALKLPFFSATPILHVVPSREPPVNISSDQLPFWWFPRTMTQQQALHSLFMAICLPHEASPQVFRDFCAEFSLLLGVLNRFLRWLSIIQMSHSNYAVPLNYFQGAHNTFFTVPNVLLKYFHRLKLICHKASRPSLNCLIKRLSVTRWNQSIQLLINLDLNRSHMAQPQRCVLCPTQHPSVLLGPFVVFDGPNGIDGQKSKRIHRECLFWSCVSFTREKFNISASCEGSHDFCIPENIFVICKKKLSHGISFASFLIEFLCKISVHSACYFCNLPHATVYCHSCEYGPYHLNCYLIWASTLDICCFDLLQRTVYRCPACFDSPVQSSTTSPWLKALYPQGFLAALSYFCQATIPLLTSSPFCSITKKNNNNSFFLSRHVCNFFQVNPWVRHRYKTFVSCLPLLKSFSFYIGETQPLRVPLQFSSLYFPSVFHLISPGNTITSLTAFSAFTTSQLSPHGFHSQRLFWDPTSLSRIINEKEKINSVLDCLAIFHCRVERVSASSSIYRISRHRSLKSATQPPNESPLEFFDETLSSCVLKFFQCVIPLLKYCFPFCDLGFPEILNRLPSVTDFFGFEHPQVVATRQLEKSLLQCYAIFNATDIPQTPTTTNILHVDLTGYKRPYRSRLWMMVFPPQSTTHRELGATYSDLPHYSELDAFTHEQWDRMKENRNLYVIKSTNVFPIHQNITIENFLNPLAFSFGCEPNNAESSTYIQDELPSITQTSSFNFLTNTSNCLHANTKKGYFTGQKFSRLRSTRLNCIRQQVIKTPFNLHYKHLVALMTQATHVKARLSGIHGMGLFAISPIAKGQPIVEYVGDLIRNIVADQRETLYRQHGMKDSSCYMFRLNSQYVIDGTVSGNVSRFINHSCEPNCVCRIIADEDGDEHIIIFASCPIACGEEITYDYKFNVEEESLRLKCLCGARGCLGRMN